MTKFIGGLLLIIGTSIGAGILALPVTTAQSGFISSTLLLFFCWAIMSLSALMILEVNLWFPQDSNMISMAKHTLGLPGEVLAWISYLLLLYALLCAYIAGGADVFGALLDLIGIHTPQWLDTVLFTVILGSIVFCGIQATDYANRILMTIKLSAFVILTALVVPQVQPHNLTVNEPQYLPSAIMVMITSFGFATIVPSLRSYFNSDAKKLRNMIILGSFVPLICYIIWDFAILGSLPLTGKDSLTQILHGGHVTSDLMIALQQVVNKTVITQLSRVFTSICVFTSFLGVALCLSDFLADGFKIQKLGLGRIAVSALTFLPPLVIVLFYPNAFIMALTYAGICCVFLLVILPTLMVWRGTTTYNFQPSLKFLANRGLLTATLLIGLGLFALGTYQTF
jgi:tyrosine-specific transport protein